MVSGVSRQRKTVEEKMDSKAMNVKTVNVSADQHYEWGVVESPYSKIKKYACIDYHFRGAIWNEVFEFIKTAQIRPFSMLYYKGAQVDKPNKTLKVRGPFVRDVLGDKYFAFWSAFFKCGEKESPKIICLGRGIKLPSIAGDLDSLHIFIDGMNVNEFLSEPTLGDMKEIAA
jgi:hypothetical protein